MCNHKLYVECWNGSLKNWGINFELYQESWFKTPYITYIVSGDQTIEPYSKTTLLGHYKEHRFWIVKMCRMSFNKAEKRFSSRLQNIFKDESQAIGLKETQYALLG